MTEQTKVKHCQNLARGRCFEELLRATEIAARKAACPNMCRILKKLRNGQENWATEAIEALRTESSRNKPSAESSLMLKTRLGLSKNKYTGITSFMRRELHQKTFDPWADMVAHRKSILPNFSQPNYDKGYLSSSVSVRELLAYDISRITQRNKK